MSNGAEAAILDADAARSATDTRRAAIRAAGTGFSVGRMLAVTRKELRSYFAFPLVYVLSGVFLVLAGYYAYTDLVFFVTIAFAHDIMQNYWSLLFTDVRLCLLLTLPFLTMRLFAEERKLGTIELLYTYPLRDTEIFWGKFLASLTIFLMMLAFTLLYPAYLYTIHRFQLFPLVSGYLGMVLVGTVFIAIGIFISSLCESQVVAGIVTVISLSMFWALNWNEAAYEGWVSSVVKAISIYDHFEPFAKGVIDTYEIAFFIFLTTFFSYLTLRSMEARKWTGRR